MLEGLISKMNQYHHQPQQPLAHVMEDSLSNLTSASGEASNSSINPSVGEAPNLHPPPIHPQEQNPPPNKKKRSLPGNPDPDSEVIALSPKSLLAKNRFLCEICNKGFQRDQNLQLHRRGHNLPWKLKQRSKTEVVRRKVYVCPETSCVHHDPSRALGDLTGIKKHFCRKHGEKKWKCEKCSKKYAVQSDWKAHSKICGTREYRCDCGTLFSRRDSFITHRAFCDVLAEEAARSTASNPLLLPTPSQHQHQQQQQQQMPRHHYNQYQQMFSSDQNPQLINAHDLHPPFSIKQESQQQQSQGFNLIPPWLSFNQGSMQAPLQRNPSHGLLGGPTGCFGAPSSSSSSFLSQSSPQMSATALLQKAAQIGATMSSKITQASQQDQFQFPAATSAGHQGPHDHVSAILTNTPTTTTAGFGLNLSPQDHHHQQQQQQEMMMNNAINSINGASGGGGGVVNGGGGSNFASSSSPSLLLHDLMMNSLSSSFDGDDNPFANGGNDGLTRDFLGLRPLSTSDILSFAGFGNSMANLDNGAPNNVSSSSVSHQDDLHDNKSWQG